MSFTKIIDLNGFDDALWCLRSAPEYDNAWRLYAVWCARRVQHLMGDPRSLAALDVAEHYLNSGATEPELVEAKKNAEDARWDAMEAAQVALAAEGTAVRVELAAGGMAARIALDAAAVAEDATTAVAASAYVSATAAMDAAVNAAWAGAGEAAYAARTGVWGWASPAPAWAEHESPETELRRVFNEP